MCQIPIDTSHSLLFLYKPRSSKTTKIKVFDHIYNYLLNGLFLSKKKNQIRSKFLTYNTVIRSTRFCDFSDVTMHKAQMTEVYKYLHTGFDKYPCVCATKTAGSLKLDAENRNMLFHIE